MKRFYSSALALLVTAVTFASPAPAAPVLRAPQVTFSSAALQARLNSLGEAINVNSDQYEGFVWGSTVSTNSTLTIQFDLAGNLNSDALGIVRSGLGVPSLADHCEVFPATADSGWFAVASFRPGDNLIVSRFDKHANYLGNVSYTGVNRSLFGYYISNQGGTFYSKDALNGDGKPHALAFAGTGENTGNWWLTWEDASIVDTQDADYDDVIVFMESLNPTPVSKTSWGSLKSRFR